jgi:uncharacterized protein (TIGR02996 family)
MSTPTFTAEDKAFLRAILDNPADTTARLVYADWLDDRSDPRGTYLRVEMDLRAQADPNCDRAVALREWLVSLKRDIDPFWLACFDRPDIEGCEEHFAFRCPKKWEHLRTTEYAEVRYCDGCRRHVFYCDSIAEARARANQGECVAISLTVLRTPGDITFPGAVEDDVELGELDPDEEDELDSELDDIE